MTFKEQHEQIERKAWELYTHYCFSDKPEIKVDECSGLIEFERIHNKKIKRRAWQLYKATVHKTARKVIEKIKNEQEKL